MFILDLFEMGKDSAIEENPPGYSTEQDDQSILTISDLRKTRLTLDQLNKLRQINDIRKIEHEKKIKTLSAIYKPPAQEQGGM